MVPAKFFRQLLKNLDDPQPHAVRNQQHWWAPILSSSAGKITYCLFDLNTLRLKLGKQNTVILKEQVSWNGDNQVSDNLCEMDPMEALAAAKRHQKIELLAKVILSLVMGKVGLRVS